MDDLFRDAREIAHAVLQQSVVNQQLTMTG